jgi:hypothetical protein
MSRDDWPQTTPAQEDMTHAPRRKKKASAMSMKRDALEREMNEWATVSNGANISIQNAIFIVLRHSAKARAEALEEAISSLKTINDGFKIVLRHSHPEKAPLMYALEHEYS